MTPRRADSEQWFAVLDADGQPVSEGTILADPLPDGMTAVPVDGPSDGRPWDGTAQAWGPLPEPPEEPPADPATIVLPALAVIAADATKTRDQRVDAILAALAAAAPTT